MLRIIDERVSSLKNEILKESKIRAESIDNINQCLEVIIIILNLIKLNEISC